MSFKPGSGGRKLRLSMNREHQLGEVQGFFLAISEVGDLRQ